MMNKTSRFLAIGISALIGLSTLWSCDKESEQENPEGTGIFVVRNGTTTPLYYHPDGTQDTLLIDTFSLTPIEIYKEEESQASPMEFYAGKELILYKYNTAGTKLVETYKQSPVVNSEWIVQKKDDLEYGVTQYTLLVNQTMLY